MQQEGSHSGATHGPPEVNDIGIGLSFCTKTIYLMLRTSTVVVSNCRE